MRTTTPNRWLPGPARRGRAAEPTLRELLIGVTAFLLVAAACLYAVALLGS
jgi:hypothetical protein